MQQAKLDATTAGLLVEVAAGDLLDVREFTIVERMSGLFEIDLIVVCDNPSLAFDAIVGSDATVSFADARRSWKGVCNDIELVRAQADGVSTYTVKIVPALWFATQRRNHRMFQQISDKDIVKKMLVEWQGKAVADELAPIDETDISYKERKYRVQYAEDDYAFMCRLLEEAGISFYFNDESRIVLNDKPNRRKSLGMVPFVPEEDFEFSAGTLSSGCVTKVKIKQRVRPGVYTVADHDHRKASGFRMHGSDRMARGVEQHLERFHYIPGAFLYASGGGSTPVGDDKGTVRHDLGEGEKLATRRLESKRASAKVVTVVASQIDLPPGTVFQIEGHPHAELPDQRELLVLQTVYEGKISEEWTQTCTACFADLGESGAQALRYRPATVTPKPHVMGIESATVVGPAGEEIHTDELGRVRVHFHWDRESEMNDNSSCWIHSSQPWAGTGFGGINLPRIGQEVIVNFLGGDPDRPIIVGRVYTELEQVPYDLPANKTQSGWKTQSSPGGTPANFNEIRFEDKIGEELVYQQAELDREHLVKRDETQMIGRDRTETVMRDEDETIVHNRSVQVGDNKKETVGLNRMRFVGVNETVGIGNDQSLAVGRDRFETEGRDKVTAVGRDCVKTIGRDNDVSIASNRTVRVGLNKSETIGANRARQVGANETVNVGANRSVQVGANQSTKIGVNEMKNVGMMSNEQVGLVKTVTVGAVLNTAVTLMSSEQVGLIKYVIAGMKIVFQCGAASITLNASGEIAIKGTKIKIDGAEHIGCTSALIDLN